MVSKMYEVFNIIYYLMKLNGLWFLFVIRGGIVLGFIPSTIALYSCIRCQIRSGNDTHLYRRYKQFYTSEFRRSVLFSFLFLLTGLIILGESSLLISMGREANLVLEITVKLTRLVLVLLGIMFFPVFVHYDVKGSKSFIQPLMFILICPIEVIIIGILVLICWFLFSFSPLLLFFIGVSLPAYGISVILIRRFERLDEKISISTGEVTKQIASSKK
jgi:uncharacterized membrane protein YesL